MRHTLFWSCVLGALGAWGCSRTYEGSSATAIDDAGAPFLFDAGTVHAPGDDADVVTAMGDGASDDAAIACVFPNVTLGTPACGQCAQSLCCAPAVACLGQSACSAYVQCYASCYADAAPAQGADDPCVASCSSDAKVVVRGFAWLQCLRDNCKTVCP